MCKKYRVQLSWGIATLSKTNLTGSDRWSLVIRILDGWNNNVPNLLGYPVNHTLHHLPTHSSQLPILFAWLTRLCLNEGFQLKMNGVCPTWKAASSSCCILSLPSPAAPLSKQVSEPPPKQQNGQRQRRKREPTAGGGRPGFCLQLTVWLDTIPAPIQVSASSAATVGFILGNLQEFLPALTD